MSDLTIGQAARSAGVNVETIRYYQRTGLVDEPEKPIQGYRRYSLSVIERIRFIKRAQELGFTLTEAADLLNLNEMNCDEARELAEHKREVIQQRIDDLAAIQAELDKLISACKQAARQDTACAILGSLGTPE